MNPNGRHKTRTREDLLITIYRLVHSKMVVYQTTNIKKVCDLIFKQNELIKFYDNTNFYLFDVCKTSENLRKRYYDTLTAAKDKDNFPHLSQIVDRYKQLLPLLIEQQKLQCEFMSNEIKNGHAGKYFNSNKERDEYLALFAKPL